MAMRIASSRTATSGPKRYPTVVRAAAIANRRQLIFMSYMIPLTSVSPAPLDC